MPRDSPPIMQDACSAYINAIVNFMDPTVLLDKYVILLGSTVLLNTYAVSCSL